MSKRKASKAAKEWAKKRAAEIDDHGSGLVHFATTIEFVPLLAEAFDAGLESIIGRQDNVFNDTIKVLADPYHAERLRRWLEKELRKT